MQPISKTQLPVTNNMNFPISKAIFMSVIAINILVKKRNGAKK